MAAQTGLLLTDAEAFTSSGPCTRKSADRTSPPPRCSTCTDIDARTSRKSSISFAEDSQLISNDVGNVKTHLLRVRPPEPALISQEPAEAAVARVAAVLDVHAPRSIRVTASRRCPAPNISSVTADHDDSCELPPPEGGGSPNQCFGHSRTRTRADTGIPARTPRLRLPRQATTAELRRSRSDRAT